METEKKCPLSRFNMCTDECEWFNKNLKGCHVSSLVININRFIRSQMRQSVKDKGEYEKKYGDKTQEERKEELF